MRDERDVLHDERQEALTPEVGLEIPGYPVHFGIPAYLATIVISFVDPLAGLMLLAVVAIMVITLNVLFRLDS